MSGEVHGLHKHLTCLQGLPPVIPSCLDSSLKVLLCCVMICGDVHCHCRGFCHTWVGVARCEALLSQVLLAHTLTLVYLGSLDANGAPCPRFECNLIILIQFIVLQALIIELRVEKLEVFCWVGGRSLRGSNFVSFAIFTRIG